MRYDTSKFKKLTDESKDVWDYIHNNTLPIVKRSIVIEPDYMFKVLKKAIDDGIISTNTRRWCNLYWFRNQFKLYLCESWLVRILYSMDIPICYIYEKQIDNSDWYRFFAKIKFIGGWRESQQCIKLIDNQTNRYIKGDLTIDKEKWDIISNKLQ